MSDIFISYASEDKGRVQALARALERKGWSVWWDRRIPAGKSFDEVIHEALKTAKSVVVVWTKTSVKSTWVKNESRSGMRRGILFPVMLLDEVEIPLEFEHLQAAHLMDWQPDLEHAGFDQFIDDLAGVIGPPVTSSAQPKIVTPSEESASARVESKPEPETEPLSTTVVEVERVSERLEPRPAIELGGAVRLDSPRDTCMSQGATESSEVRQEPVHLNDDRARESTGTGQSTDSLPYVPIGIGLIAVIGAAVYFLLFSQGPSPVREVAPYQPTVQAPSARTEVVTPAPAPESVTPSTTGTPQEKPVAKQGAGSAKTITGKDGAPMVLVPSGSFQMGSTRVEVDRAIKACVKELEKDQQTCEGWYESELPQHKVQINAFYLDKYEVTNRLFQQFVQQTGHQTAAEQEGSAKVFVEGKGWEDLKGASWRKPEAGATVFDSNRAEHPVVSVTWVDARAYCRWAGKRLPTEAEFEYAMRAGTTTTYWWGEGSPGSRRVENVADEAATHLLKGVMSEYNDGTVRTAPGGIYEANPWGLHDMSGNVSEWVADWYGADYYESSPAHNPKGPSSGQYRVLRGGSWDDEPDLVRSAYRNRNTPTNRNDDIGFRCAQDVPK